MYCILEMHAGIFPFNKRRVVFHGSQGTYGNCFKLNQREVSLNYIYNKNKNNEM